MGGAVPFVGFAIGGAIAATAAIAAARKYREGGPGSDDVQVESGGNSDVCIILFSMAHFFTISQDDDDPEDKPGDDPKVITSLSIVSHHSHNIL